MTAEPAIAIRRATAADESSVAACVDAAYSRYIERMGKPPGPMLEDYAKIIATHQVSVVELDGAFAGVIVLAKTEEGFLLDNVAVHPAFHGKGIGRRLLEYAESEAKRAGYREIHLYTHESMIENQAHYSKIGYVEYDRRVENGYSRAYMRKRLA